MGAQQITTGAAAVDRALALLLRIGRSPCDEPLAHHARELGLPPSTAHRLAAALEARGLLSKAAPGVFVLGPAARDLAPPGTPDARLAKYARGPLRRLAVIHGVTAHLGVWDGDMVHYLVKEPTHSALLTSEGGRLEGYCSAIGKVLLADLPPAAREAYVAGGPFIALTERTITDEAALARCLRQVGRRGYAVDDEEVATGLRCVAVPVRRRDGRVAAAISASGPSLGASPAPALLGDLRRSARVIARL